VPLTKGPVMGGVGGSGVPAEQVLELTGEATAVRDLLADFWRRRSLVPMLAAKEFQARYRSATFGVLWGVALPLLQGAVLAIVFTVVVRIRTGVSYPVFVIAGQVLWSYFQASVTMGSTSIVDQGGIAGKVYFPRLVLPAVPALSNLVGFLISLAVTLALMGVFGVQFRATLFLLPVVVVFEAVLVVTLSSLLTVAHVYFRDVRYMTQAALLVLFYATPIIYPIEQARRIRLLLLVNPLTGVLQLSRQAIFAKAHDLLPAVLSTIAWIIALSAATVLVYRRHERVACDRL